MTIQYKIAGKKHQTCQAKQDQILTSQHLNMLIYMLTFAQGLTTTSRPIVIVINWLIFLPITIN